MILQRFIISIMFVLSMSDAHAGTCQLLFAKPFNNHSDHFGRGVADSLYEKQVIEYLSDKEVLFVGGFGFDITVKMGLPYFRDQARWLREHSISYSFANVRSLNDIEMNGQIIRQAILAASKKLFIISHSRGGVDVLESLIKLSLEGQNISERIGGWISLQTPFWGAKTTENISRRPLLEATCRLCIQGIGGNPKFLNDLSTFSRVEYMTRHRDIIDQILNQLPILTYGSTGTTTKKIRLLQKLFPDVFVIPDSDGTVEVKNTFIAGFHQRSSHIIQQNVDHREIVFNGPLDRMDFTSDILSAWMSSSSKLTP